MRCAAYIRVSTDKEEQKTSIINQKNLFIHYIQEQKWTVYDFYIDIETGTTAKRENLQRLITDAKQKKFDVIIAKELSRLARNGSLSYQIRDVAQNNRIGIITLDGAVNSVEGDVSKYGLYTWLYEEESQRTSERVKSALQSRARKGLFKSSVAPYGYFKEHGMLKIAVDGTAEIVKWIFEQYILGRGFDSIARELYKKGLPTPSMVAKKKNASYKWHGSSIRLILENNHYTGNLVQYRETTTSATNKTRIKIPKDKQIIVPNTHERIIPEETFNLVQDIIKSRSGKRTVGKKHLFSSIIFCYDCGSSMHFKYNRRGYVCGGYVKYSLKFCKNHAVKEVDISKKIIDDIKKIRSVLVDRDAPSKLEKVMKKETEIIGKQIEIIDIKLEKLQIRKAKLITLLIDETINKEDYLRNASDFEKEIAVLSTKRADLLTILEKEASIKELETILPIMDGITQPCEITIRHIAILVKEIKVKQDGTPIIEYRYNTLNHMDELY